MTDEELVPDEMEEPQDDDIEVKEEKPKSSRIERSRKRSSRLKTVSKKKSKRSKKVARPATAGGPSGPLRGAPFQTICSECYEEFTIDPNADTDEFNCPECDHPCKFPEDEVLQEIFAAKKQEKKNLKIAFVFFGILVIAALVWIFLLVDPTMMEDQAVNYGLLFVVFASLVAGIVFSIKYEIKRYDTYF